jgi:predicted amidohydrolase YtcJ
MIRFNNLILFNGTGFTEPKSVVIENDIFKWIGDVNELPQQYCGSAISIEANGLLAIPSFVDSHIHFLGLAAKLQGNNLALSDNAGLTEFTAQLKEISKLDPQSEWLRIYDLDPFHPVLEKLISKDIIDSCISNRPVIIRFSSGHGVLLNSVAMKQLKITDSTDEIKGSTFGRSIETGKLTGVFYEIETLLNDYVPLISRETIIEGVKDANNLLLSKGFTSIMDATAENDLSRLNLFADFIDKGIIDLDVSFMLGYEYLEEFINIGIKYGTDFRGVTIGHVKLMTSLSSGKIYPDDLDYRINRCHSLGFPVAIHAVEKDIVSLVAEILADNYMEGDRVEHVTELDDMALDVLSKHKIGVSVNPSFIYEHGDRYIRVLESNVLKLIYRFKSMLEKDLIIGFASDAPVAMPSGLKFINAATKRRTKYNKEIGCSEKLTIDQAINMATFNNYQLNDVSYSTGKISQGNSADMILVKFEDLLGDKDYICDEVALTMQRGQIIHSNL